MPAHSKPLGLIPTLNELIAIFSLALVYFLLAKLAAFYASDFAGNVMAIWPASGVALAVVLVYGYRMVLGAGLGSFCFNLLYFSADSEGMIPAVLGAGVIAAGSMLEFVAAAYFIRQNFPDLAPETLKKVALYILIAGASGVTGAATGSLGLMLAERMDFAHAAAIVFTWWLGDTAGMLVITPLLLVWLWPHSRKGLLFPLVAPCTGLTLVGFFIVHQFEIQLLQTTVKPGNYLALTEQAWLSWNILIGGMALTFMLAVYLDSHRRKQAALQESELRLKKQSRALSQIARNDSIYSGDLESALKMLTETTAATLQVERTSIWLFNSERTMLHCADLYQLSGNCHSAGMELTTIDYPSYFAALLDARNIAVDDAATNPATQELRQHYLPQYSISSLLDAPIQFGGKLAGVVCHEQVGAKRHWTPDEQNFAGSIADLAALVFEVARRKEAEAALRIANQELELKVQERTAELVKLNSSLLAEINQHRRTETVLRDSELRLRLATKAADIGVWDWNLINNAVIFSPEWKRQIGYQDREIANNYLEWESRLHPDDKERTVAANMAHIEGQAPEYGVEFRLRHKDGSYRWIYSRGEVVARASDGKATRIMGCHVDITELKQSEEALRAFRWFAESAGQGMGMARLNSEVVYMNPELVRTLKKLGLSTEPPGVLNDYFSEDAAHQLQSEVLPALLDSGQWTGELELGRARRIPVLNNFFAVCDEARQPQYIACVITDMSQQQEMKRRLLEAKEAAESADRTKSMFIATMSHELRTPLNAIIGFTGILLQGLSGSLNDRQQDQLSRVARSARHLLELITDIIDISKIEAGRIDVFPESFDLQELISQAIDTVKGQAHEKGLSLVADVPETLSMISDRKRMLQCIINLLSNALKYTEKGHVLLTARANEKTVSIAVKDSGIGIDQEQMQRLFMPFERLDSSLRLRTSGTGLGLYMTRKIAADLLRGDVSVVSEPGVGSCFTLQVAKQLPVPTQMAPPAIL